MRGNLPLGGTSPAGELRHRSCRWNGVGSVYGEKVVYGEKSAVRGVRCTQKTKHDDESKDCKTLPYGVQKSKIQTITRFNLYRFAVQASTSTDRTGCTNFFREKMHFLRAGVDKRFDAYKTPHSAATGQIDVVGGFKVIAAVVLS